MNWRSILSGVVANARSGYEWYAEPRLYGTVAGKLDKEFQVIANDMMGYDLNSGPGDRGWVRNNFRIPFLDRLFGDVYPDRVLNTSKKLTDGECRAVLKFLELPESQRVLEMWIIEESEVSFA